MNKWLLEGNGSIASSDYKHLIKCLVNDSNGLDVACDETARMVCDRLNAQGWQPIETAPAEGQFLVYMPEETRQPIQVAKWSPNIKVIGNVFSFDMKPVTHWHPLPEFKEES